MISKKNVYSKSYFLQKEHKAKPKATKESNKKTKQKRKLITKEERTKERRERITSCESSSPRLVKKRSIKGNKQLISETIYALKSPPITFLPDRP